MVAVDVYVVSASVLLSPAVQLQNAEFDTELVTVCIDLSSRVKSAMCFFHNGMGPSGKKPQQSGSQS